jgi:hypothetical protein
MTYIFVERVDAVADWRIISRQRLLPIRLGQLLRGWRFQLMRRILRNRLSIFFYLISLILLTGCGAGGSSSLQPGALAPKGHGPEAGGREVILGENFKILIDEKVSVKETNLMIELKGTRNSWYADGKGGFVEAEVLVALDGKEQRRWMKLGDEMTSGEYTIRLMGVDPFGRKSNAELIVKRR